MCLKVYIRRFRKLGFTSEILYNPVEIKNKQLIYNKKLYCTQKKIN